MDEDLSYVDKNGNLTFTKVTISGGVYTTTFSYSGGTYTFNTKLSSVTTESELLQNYYDFLSATTIASAIVAIYDDDTAKEVSSVTVSSELDNGHLSLDKHGAIWVDSPIEETPFGTDN